MISISVRRMFLCLLLLSGSAVAFASGPQSQLGNPWTDPRLVAWSAEMNLGQYTQVIREVEADLVSSAPHPFSIDIWCRLQLRQDTLDIATAAITDPALNRALGIAPRIYSLDHSGKVGELRRLARTLSPEVIHGAFTYRILVGNAMTATDNDQAFDWAIHALRTQEPSFLLVWLVINIEENDLRIRTRLKTVLSQDTAFRETPAGSALSAMLPLIDEDSSIQTNCRDRVPSAESAFIGAAETWLASFPRDAGALAFIAIHRVDLNDDPDISLKALDAGLDAYPLLQIGVARDAVSKAEFALPGNTGDKASLALNARWADLLSGSRTKAQASAAFSASRSLRGLTGCDHGARTDTARNLITASVKTLPQTDQGNLFGELAELDLINGDSTSATQAVDEARQALKHSHDLYYITLLVRALLKTDRNEDAAEGLQLYKSTLADIADHSEDFYTAGDLVLEHNGTCQDREQNWESARKEFPNAAWALFHLAEAQDRCGRPQDAIQTMTAMFQIVEQSPYYLAEMQSLWTQMGNISDIPSQRNEFARTFPNNFRQFAEPESPVRILARADAVPEKLRLVPQLPPTGKITAMTLNSNGTLAASADADGVIKLWGMEAVPHGKTAALHAVCVSIVDRTCPRILRDIPLHTGTIRAIGFSADSQWLVSEADDGQLSALRVSDGQLTWSLQAIAGTKPQFAVQPPTSWPSALVASLAKKPDPPNGSQVPSGRGWSMLTLCSLAGDSPCRNLNWYSNFAFDSSTDNSLVWSADGRRLAIRVSDTETLLLDVDTMHMRELRHSSVPKEAAYNGNLSAVLFRKDSTLTYQELSVGAKPVNLVEIAGDLLDKQILPDGRVRFAVLEPEPKPLEGPLDSPAVSKKTRQRFIDVLQLRGPAPQASEIIASIPAAEYPVPTLKLGDERFTIFSRRFVTPIAQMSQTSTLPFFGMAIVYYSPVDPLQPVLQRLVSQPQMAPNSLAFTTDNHELLVGRGELGGTHIDLWDLAAQGQPLQPMIEPAVGPVIALNGSSIITCVESGSNEGFLRFYDLQGHEVPAPTPQHCRPDMPLVALADSSGFVWSTGLDTATIQLSGSPAWETGPLTEGDRIRAMAGTSKLLLAATDQGIFSIEKGGTAKDLCNEFCPSGTASFSALTISADGRFVLAAVGPALAHSIPQPSTEYGVLVVDLQQGTLRMQKDSGGDLHMAITSIAFQPNSTRYVAGTVDGRLLFADATEVGEMDVFAQQDSGIAGITFSSDGLYLAAALNSGPVVLWQRGPEKHQLAELDTFTDGDWSVVSPNGQYDAAHAGRLNELFWVYGNSTIQLDQMLSSYYRSRLLPRLMGIETATLEPSPTLDASSLPPMVNVIPDPLTGEDVSASGEIVFSINKPIADVGSIQVFLNNSPVSTSSQRVSTDGLVHVSLSRHHTFASGELNKVAIVVSNRDSSIASRGFERTYKAPGEPEEEPQQFYAIIAGISNYAGDLGPLPLAGADAKEMAQVVARGARELVEDPSRVHIILLSSDDNLGKEPQKILLDSGLVSAQWMPPTHDNFLKAFATFNKVPRKDDIFLLFVAGHGLLLGKNYIYPTSEFASSKAPLPGTYLTTDELTSGLEGIGAPHTILLFDTCNSGAALGALLSGTNASIDAENQELESINQNLAAPNSNTYMLMAAGGNASAYDLAALGHGFLTAGLLLSMRQSLVGDDLFAQAWLSGAEQRTRELAERYGYRQNAPGAQPGDQLRVAKLPPDELACIPDVDTIPPLLTLPYFENSSGNDSLSLTPMLMSMLKAAPQPDDPVPSFVYQDASSADHITIKVHYDTSAGRINGTISFHYGVKGEYEQPAKTFALPISEMPTDDEKENLAEIILARINDYAKWVWSQKRGKGQSIPKTCGGVAATLAST